MPAPITSSDVRTYIQDNTALNYLLDGLEFPDAMVTLAMTLAVDEFNMIPPIGGVSLDTFPSATILMHGTLSHLMEGQTALLARNTMEYSDGGLQVPVEERAPLYAQMVQMYHQSFVNMSKQYKISQNMENGWGSVASDEAMFPDW